MKPSLKTILVALCAVCAAIPAVTLAQLDQRCWKQEDCISTRTDMYPHRSEQEYADGFVVNEETRTTCKTYTDEQDNQRDFGFCLPAGKTKTNIGFGGKKEFEHIADYIKTVYRYAVWAGGVIAVIMIMIAGVQWTMSGGNSSTVQSAKQRIGGSIMGVVLLALSYTILIAINPYLVNLRLPQVWLINKVGYVPNSCKDVSTGKKMAEAFKKDNPVQGNELSKRYQTAVEKGKYTSLDASAIPCGDQYFIEGAGLQTCVGSSCGKGNLCMPFHIQKTGDLTNVEPGFFCWKGDMVAHLKLSFSLEALKSFIPFAGIKWDVLESGDWIDTSVVKVVAVCDSPTSDKIQKGDDEDWDASDESYLAIITENFAREYLYQYKNILKRPDKEWCGNPDLPRVAGFVLYFQLKEDWTPVDPDVFVGYDGSQVYLGNDIDEIEFKAGRYITKEQIEEGLYIKIEFDGADLKSLLK